MNFVLNTSILHTGLLFFFFPKALLVEFWNFLTFSIARLIFSNPLVVSRGVVALNITDFRFRTVSSSQWQLIGLWAAKILLLVLWFPVMDNRVDERSTVVCWAVRRRCWIVGGFAMIIFPCTEPEEGGRSLVFAWFVLARLVSVALLVGFLELLVC